MSSDNDERVINCMQNDYDKQQIVPLKGMISRLKGNTLDLKSSDLTDSQRSNMVEAAQVSVDIYKESLNFY